VSEISIDQLHIFATTFLVRKVPGETVLVSAEYHITKSTGCRKSGDCKSFSSISGLGSGAWWAVDEYVGADDDKGRC
jgi:hypothetical protein